MQPQQAEQGIAQCRVTVIGLRPASSAEGPPGGPVMFPDMPPCMGPCTQIILSNVMGRTAAH